MSGARRAVVAPPLGRLAAVEVRKCLDTHVARWVAGTVLVATALGVLVAGVAAPAGSVRLGLVLTVVAGVLGHVLPVLVILLVTGEWSERTALVTFVLEPRRGRVAAAKLLAGLALAGLAMLLAAVLAVVGTLLAHQRGAADWSLEPARVVGSVVAMLVAVLVGFPLAMLLLRPAAAIVAYVVYALLVPAVVGALSVLHDGFAAVAPWIDLGTAQALLTAGDDLPGVTEVVRLLVTGTLWVLLPLVLAVLRLQRAAVR